MSIKEKLKSAVDASMYQYPYQNLSLVDMVGEIWKPLPNYEDYYEISNLGRVKVLYRVREHQLGKNLVQFQTPEAIRSQHPSGHFNSHLKETRYRLSFKVWVDNKRLITARAVYEAFIAPLKHGDTKTVVLQKDNNPLNNRVENLYLSTRKELNQRVFDLGRRDINAYKKKQWTKDELIARSKSLWVMVSQYDKAGNYVATFESIKEAKEQTGIRNIQRTAAKAEHYMAGGYYWRQGNDKNKIDVEPLQKQRHINIHSISRKIWKKVSKYTIEGRFIETYPSIVVAATKNNLHRKVIDSALRKEDNIGGNFIWKLV